MPTIAARTRMEPATAPAIAPPLTSVMFVDKEDGEGAAVVVLAIEGVTSDVKLDDKLDDVLCPKGMIPRVVVVRTVLLYPVVAAHPYPLDPCAYR